MWHTHPLGQTSIVTAGVGRVQRWGDPIQEIRAGDVVWIPPGQKRWHGAAPKTAMTHIAILEQAAHDDPRSVVPALEHYTERILFGGVWERQGPSRRDRSIVTIASLIARGQTIELPRYLNIALDSGVKPSAVSEMITHLTFYAGWANVFTALPVVKGVLERRP